MTSFLDIIGAMLVGGTLLMVSITALDSSTQAFVNFNADAIVQQNLASTAKIIEYDLSKMGFGVPEAQKNLTLQEATSTNLKYLVQLNNGQDNYVPIPGVGGFDNTVDSVEYTISWADSVNFRDTTVHLYSVDRKLTLSTGQSVSGSIGVIGNQDVFRYLDQLGKIAPIMAATRMIEVTLTAHDPNVILSPELVVQAVGTDLDAERRKRELRRILRASYFRQTKLVSKNLRR